MSRYAKLGRTKRHTSHGTRERLRAGAVTRSQSTTKGAPVSATVPEMFLRDVIGRSGNVTAAHLARDMAFDTRRADGVTRPWDGYSEGRRYRRDDATPTTPGVMRHA